MKMLSPVQFFPRLSALAFLDSQPSLGHSNSSVVVPYGLLVVSLAHPFVFS